MRNSQKQVIEKWLKRIDALSAQGATSDRSMSEIKITDTEGNELSFRIEDGQTILQRAKVKTPVIHLPSAIEDNNGMQHQLTVIENNAFLDQQTLKHLIIPNGVLSIEIGVFTHCGSLLSVVIPPSVQKLDAAFWNCPTFEENAGGIIYYTGTHEQWRLLIDSIPHRRIMDYTPYDKVVQYIPNDTIFEIPELDFQTTYDEDFEMEISRVRVCELGGEVTIPESYTDPNGVVQKIIHVGRSAFAENNKIERVIIPPSVQRICQDAFYHCTNLREVVILKGDVELDIEMGAFFSCEHLEKVYVGRPCWWGEHALEKTNAQKIEID